jgi:hypothetical protein
LPPFFFKFLVLGTFFYGVFVRFSFLNKARGVQKHHFKKALGEVHVKGVFEGGGEILSFFNSIFFNSVFCRFSA